MLSLVILLFISQLTDGQLISTCLSSTGNKNHNDEWVEGNFLIKCTVTKSGSRTNILACLTDGKQSVVVDSSLREGDFIYECILEGNSVRFQQRRAFNSSCTDNEGVKHRFDAVWAQGFYEYRCDKFGRFVVNGCVSKTGRRIDISGVIRENEQLVSCHKLSNNAYQIQYITAPDANCADRENITHKYGSWWISKFNFNKTCTSNGQIKIANCISDEGDKIPLNGQLIQGGYIVKCTQNGNKYIGINYERDPKADCFDRSIHKKRNESSTWFFNGFAYKCMPKGNIKSIGCTTKAGQFIEPNHYFNEGTILKFCNFTDNARQAVTAGCFDPRRSPDPNDLSSHIAHNSHWKAGNGGMRCSWFGIRPFQCRLPLPIGEKSARPGDWWQVGKTLYICLNEKNKPVYRKIENNGLYCADEHVQGELTVSRVKVYVGGLKTQDRVVWICEAKRRADNTLKLILRPFACESSDGKLIAEGSLYKDLISDVWYACEKDSTGQLRNKQAGCTDSKGALVPFGQTFEGPTRAGWEMMMYKCDKDDKDKIKLVPTGCIYGEKVMKMGETVQEGTKMMLCKKDGTGMQPTGCAIGKKEVPKGFSGAIQGGRWKCNEICNCRFMKCTNNSTILPSKYLSQERKAIENIMKIVEEMCNYKEKKTKLLNFLGVPLVEHGNISI